MCLLDQLIQVDKELFSLKLLFHTSYNIQD